MRKVLGASLFVIMCFAVSSPAQKAGATKTAAVSDKSALPVRRVVLYKNGIGYFESSAQIDGDRDLHIDFTTDQLNDVLASLTATDTGNGRITNVRFNSVAPLSERLRALHLPLGEDPTRQQFLDALRGTRVEVTSGPANVTGKVLSVESVTKVVGQGPQTENVLVLSVVTDGGDFRSFELGPGTSVRMANHELEGDVSQYLDLIGSERAADVRRMTIADEGTGKRTVLVSYISEVPVWKSSYRILLDAGEKPLIQGWAIVDNRLGEDWDNVQLSLVSGAPQSFVEDLSVPYYLRRPVVPLPHSVLLTPQTHEEALMPGAASNSPISAAQTDELNRLTLYSRTFTPGTATGSGSGAGIGPREGGGAGGGVFQVGGNVSGAPSVAQSVLVQPQATGRSVAELFEYDIKNRVTIGRNQSALVPILQSQLEAGRVTLWNANNPVALRALDLTNSTGLTLDAGTFDVIDDGTFAGEGLFDTIRDGDKRLVSYAADPAVQVSTREGTSAEAVTRVVIAKGLMKTTRELRSTETYRVSNSDSKPRTVVIEHPLRAGWRLAGDAKPVETTPDFYRFKVDVKSKESAKLVVEEVHPETSQIELTDLTSDDVALLARQNNLAPQMEAAFRKILDQKTALAAIDQQIQQRQQEIQNISNDQNRIRENMKALKGGAEEKQLLDRYVTELNSQEDRLNALRGEIAGLKIKRDAAQAALDATIEGLSLDQTF